MEDEIRDGGVNGAGARAIEEKHEKLIKAFVAKDLLTFLYSDFSSAWTGDQFQVIVSPSVVRVRMTPDAAVMNGELLMVILCLAGSKAIRFTDKDMEFRLEALGYETTKHMSKRLRISKSLLFMKKEKFIWLKLSERKFLVRLPYSISGQQ